MKFSVGYSLIDANRFNEAVEEFRDSISDIYFSWPGTPSGRSELVADKAEYRRRTEILLEDLQWYGSLDIPLTILFNANCYGEDAVSTELLDSVTRIIERIRKEVDTLAAMTTASPYLALKIKECFPDLQIRASINMRISRTEGMEYLSDRFDFFYIAKELNRNIEQITYLTEWASANGKELGLLVNSGCLNYCSNQTFHDNLVAHEQNIKNFSPSRYQPVQCRNFLSHRKNWKHLLCSSNWVRPEDLRIYERWFKSVKLATRMHSNPYMVIAAYAAGDHRGNILDLTEPGFSGIMAPEILDNKRFPDGWSSCVCTDKDAEALLPRFIRNLKQEM